MLKEPCIFQYKSTFRIEIAWKCHEYFIIFFLRFHMMSVDITMAKLAIEEEFQQDIHQWKTGQNKRCGSFINFILNEKMFIELI